MCLAQVVKKTGPCTLPPGVSRSNRGLRRRPPVLCDGSREGLCGTSGLRSLWIASSARAAAERSADAPAHARSALAAGWRVGPAPAPASARRGRRDLVVGVAGPGYAVTFLPTGAGGLSHHHVCGRARLPGGPAHPPALPRIVARRGPDRGDRGPRRG